MRQLRWIDQVILPLGVAVLETTWLQLWLRWLGTAWADIDHWAYPSGPAMIAVVLLAALTASTRQQGHANPVVRQFPVVAGFAALLAVAWLVFGWPLSPIDPAWLGRFFTGLVTWGAYVAPEAVMIATVSYLWLVGTLLGSSNTPYAHVQRAFYLGLVLIVALLLVGRNGSGLPAQNVVGPLVFYFAAGLLALALASLESSRTRGYAATGTRIRFDRPALIAVATGVALVLLGGVAIGWVIAPDTLSNVFGLMSALVFLVVFAAAYLASLLLGLLLGSEWLAQLLANLPAAQESGPPPTAGLPAMPDELAAELAQGATQLPWVVPATRVLGFLLVLALIGAAFWLVSRQIRRIPRIVGGDETREQIGSSELLARQVRGIIDALRQRASRPPAYLAITGDDPRQQVRQAYQTLLDWAAERGHTRSPDLTPTRFADYLAALYPDETDALFTLTQAYLTARYGASAPPHGTVAAARHAAQQLAARRQVATYRTP